MLKSHRNIIIESNIKEFALLLHKTFALARYYFDLYLGLRMP